MWCLRRRPLLPSSLFLRPPPPPRLSTTSSLLLKEVRERQEGKTTYVSGVHVQSERKERLAAAPPEARPDACPLCRLGLRGLAYSDVLILSQFLAPDGTLMSIGDSKLCGSQYFKVKKLVETAQKCRLLPRPAAYEAYGPWDRLNTYHDWPPRRRDVAKRCVQPYYWKNVEHNEF